MVTVGTASAEDITRRVTAAIKAFGLTHASVEKRTQLIVVTWGEVESPPGLPMILNQSPRHHDRDVTAADVLPMMDKGNGDHLEMMPPFAAVSIDPDGGATLVSDWLGFRQIYLSEGSDWAAISTSARLLALLSGSGLDRDALALQSLLGWQVGQSTLFDRVSKLQPGARVSMRDGRSVVSVPPSEQVRHWELDDAVPAAAQMLRTYLASYVHDHPRAVLQLTGGQDSRLLLSAIPVEMRRGVTALTFSVPGSPDTRMAAEIAQRFGMDHVAVEPVELAGLSSADAYSLARESANRLDCMADPVKLAVLTLLERRVGQVDRIGGLGGEVGRGFYYLGRVQDGPVTHQRVANLAAWRMFANEAVDLDAFVPDLRLEARAIALDRVYGAIHSEDSEWFRAIDGFYLHHRMQRWAGVTSTAICMERSGLNPMLDDRFIEIARGLRPQSKAGSLFLARLQMALDPELGQIPLDDRPPPAVYAHPNAVSRLRSLKATAFKGARKVRQRIGRRNATSPDQLVMSTKIVEHWRENPETLDAVRGHGVLADEWLDRVLARDAEASPATVAFVVNLDGALSALRD